MRINIKVITNAKKTYFSFEKGIYKLHINKPPVDGKANEQIINFFAKELGIAKSKVNIVQGQKSKNKILDIDIAEHLWNDFTEKYSKQI